MKIKKTDNAGVKKAFIEGQKARSSNGNISTDGERLYSYSTCIAEKLPDGSIFHNATYYSVTTSAKHNNGYIGDIGLVCDNVPRGTSSLKDYFPHIWETWDAK